jgi:sensor c-di-GMP phosphodiesterase-like protein
MSGVRFLARLFGWLLTPVVAWAASFLGATVTAMLVRGWSNVRGQLILTISGGAIFAAIVLLLWLRLLRRSRRLRETLQVAEDATPLVVSEEGP